MSMSRKNMIRLGTYIPKESYYKLRELTELFGSQTNALEKAINLLYEVSKYSIKIEHVINRERLISEFDNILLSRKNFLHLLRGEFEKVIEENYVSAIIKRFSEQRDGNVEDIEHVIFALKKVYVDANKWFTSIDLKEGLEVVFFHDMNLEFSEFASKYFSSFFERLNYRILSIEKSTKMFTIKIQLIK